MTDSTDGRAINRRSFLKVAGTTGATVALAGCSGSNIEQPGNDSSPGGGTDESDASDKSKKHSSESKKFPVTVTIGSSPSTLDPQAHRDIPTENVVRQAYEGILARNRKGKVIDMLATKYERIESGRMRFYIRDGVTFHSGNPLSPEDVAFSINRIVKPSVSIESPQKSQLAGVTGAEVVDGKRAVDVLSDGTNPLVIAQFATYGDIMEKAWVKTHKSSYIATHMNGTGPFKLADYEQNVRVVFDRSEEYWKEPAAVTKVTFTAAKESSTRVNQLIERETDLTVNVPPKSIQRVESAKSARVAAVPSTRLLFNAMRYDVEPFSSPKFRQAMNYAIDLESIIKNVLSEFGEPTSQPTIQGFFGFDESLDPYPHDPKKAEQLVKESGHAGASITLHTPVGRYLKDVAIAQAVVGMIDQLPNVSASVKQREFTALASELTDGKIETSPHFYLIGWGNSTFDAAKTILPTLTCGSVLTTYCNEKVDSLVKGSLDVADKKKRKSMLEQANSTLHDEAPWIFLNRQYGVYGISKRLSWQPRRDERIDAYAFSPRSNSGN
jgi:peptide/nickel transport system substrate-binding protein